MPKYKSGQWDGKISIFKSTNRTLPIGLLFDFIKFHKKFFPLVNISVSDDIKKIYQGTILKTEFDLKYKPYTYQVECIEAAIKHKCNLFVCGTGGGKCLFGVDLIVEIEEKDHQKYFPEYEIIK